MRFGRLRKWLFGALRRCYHLQVLGLEQLPRGELFLIANRASLIDGWLLRSALGRDLRIITRPSQIEKTDRAGGNSHATPTVYFPECGPTRTGYIHPFPPDSTRALNTGRYRIVPVAIRAGCNFHKRSERLKSRFPWPFVRTYQVAIGAPLVAPVEPLRLWQHLLTLHAQLACEEAPHAIPMHKLVLKRTRRHPWRRAVEDWFGMRASYGALGIGAHLAALRLNRTQAPNRHVGILLPSSFAAVIANLAVLLCGRIPVNLNWTVGAEVLKASIAQLDLAVCITNARFLDRINLSLGELPTVDIAALTVRTPKYDLVLALIRWLSGREHSGLQDVETPGDATATILFSSGSFGPPSPVVLSHGGLLANIQAFNQVYPLYANDCILGFLPFFHSFGCVATLWLPLVKGLSAAYHPNPLDAQQVGELAYRSGATILVGAPTFISQFLRRIPPVHFHSLRLVVVGSEKLNSSLAQHFEAHFGVAVHEGYGATEAGPFISTNLPTVSIDPAAPPRSRADTVGLPLPDVALRVVHPETYKDVPPGQDGLFLIRAPGVLKAYLDLPEKTANAFIDGWYNTGDFGFLDSDGFIHLTGRLARFSKIGSEMVPHGFLEETLHAAVGAEETVFAVTGVKDPQRGERLVVLYTLSQIDILTLRRHLRERGLPNLWIPKANDFYRVDVIPRLGNGKLDLAGVKALGETLGQGNTHAITGRAVDRLVQETHSG